MIKLTTNLFGFKIPNRIYAWGLLAPSHFGRN